MKKISIYCDGACSGNPGPGGWGAVLIFRDNVGEFSGAEDATTNNRMELTAAVEGLKRLKETCEVDIYTDSMYVKNGITEWIKKWVENDWRNANKQEVKNRDLWEILLNESGKHLVRWHWVKGHAGNKYNEMADQLAVAAVEKFKLDLLNQKL